MKFSVTRLFPLALMFALALLSFYLDRTVRDEGGHPSLRRHDPDYLVINFSTTSFGAQGEPESVMSAAKMIHYPDDDTTELIAPRVVQTKPGKARIVVSAERGTLSREGDEVFLYDNVRLVREANGGKPEARMTTDFLHVVRERSLIRTDREITLEEDHRSISGRGMDYRYDSGELVLHADVRGTFAARKERE